MENAKYLTPEKLMETISSKKADIMAKLNRNECITVQEAEVLNNSMDRNLEKILADFKAKAMEQLKVSPEDPPYVIRTKMDIAEKLINWLSQLFTWVLNKIKEIFQRIKESAQWCLKKAKELFEYLYSLFT